MDKFVPNISFGSLLEIYPKRSYLLQTFNSVFKEIEVCFPDQNSQQLEIEDKIYLTLIIKLYNHCKNEIFNWA